MPVIDDFGTWEDLGIIPEIVDDWQFFPLFPSKETSAFRVYFQGNIELLQKWRVSCWIRGAYFSGAQYFFDQKWLRLYPKSEPEIITYPYPADLIRDPLPSRQLQVKRRLTYKREPFKAATPSLGIQILAKTDTNVIYPGEPYPAILEEEQQTT